MANTLHEMVETRHLTYWTEPNNNDKRETLGTCISKALAFEPHSIAMAFLAALEDANAKPEYAHIRAYLEGRGFCLEIDPTYELPSD